MAPSRPPFLSFSIVSLVLLSSGACCRTHGYAIPAATEACKSTYTATNEASNAACNKCCRAQRVSEGTVWGYGYCACFRNETEWYVPPLVRGAFTHSP
jgi:hypothetical protein